MTAKQFDNYKFTNYTHISFRGQERLRVRNVDFIERKLTVLEEDEGQTDIWFDEIEGIFEVK